MYVGVILKKDVKYTDEHGIPYMNGEMSSNSLSIARFFCVSRGII